MYDEQDSSQKVAWITGNSRFEIEPHTVLIYKEPSKIGFRIVFDKKQTIIIRKEEREEPFVLIWDGETIEKINKKIMLDEFEKIAKLKEIKANKDSKHFEKMGEKGWGEVTVKDNRIKDLHYSLQRSRKIELRKGKQSPLF